MAWIKKHKKTPLHSRHLFCKLYRMSFYLLGISFFKCFTLVNLYKRFIHKADLPFVHLLPIEMGGSARLVCLLLVLAFPAAMWKCNV